MSSLSTRRRILSSALAILSVVSLLGVYAAFTESISTQTQNITTGSGTLVLTDGTLRATATSSVVDLVPGDHVTRDVTITNEANYNMSTVSMSVSGTTTVNGFITDSQGLALTVEEESTPGSGSWSTLYQGALLGNVLSDIGGGVITTNGSTHLRVTETFTGPDSGKVFKGATALLTYTFVGYQRAPIVPQAGLLHTIAGSSGAGYAGDGGKATSASLNAPIAPTYDAAGNLYFIDGNSVREVDTSGIITTIAGSGATSGSSGDNGLAVNARFNSPTALSVGPDGNLYIADYNNHRIRKINLTTGIITNYAGNGSADITGDGGLATSARLWSPEDMAFDSAGDLYYLDIDGGVIRRIDATTKIITTVAGTGYQHGETGDGGQATSAQIGYSNGISVDSAGNIFIADSYAHSIREVNATTQIISTVIPSSTIGGGYPYKVFVAPTGTIYFSVSNFSYIASYKNGQMNSFVDSGSVGFSGDGAKADSSSLVYHATNMTLDPAGNFVFADTGNRRIREVNAPF